jgi:hypothetical protein
MSGEPTHRLAEWQRKQGADGGLLLVDFELSQYWHGETPLLLTAIYWAANGHLEIAVTDRALVVSEAGAAAQFMSWTRELQLFVASPARPLALKPVFIPKPWGQEIWYTGVEERGVCCFGEDERSVPIPWLQAALPDSIAGVPTEPLVLLKILDPLPDPVIGDLYFELHEEKREVYVVTRVDPRAWPDGTGYIRYGFEPQALAHSTSEAEFRDRYLSAVQAYEITRRELDALPPGQQPRQGLQNRERELRNAMNAFTHLRPLQVGDVVVVPLLMPHSLQHGVRTIEFQTPVYERKILSFAQEVQTQPHWDTAEAVRQMRLTPPERNEFEVLEQTEQRLVERIVDFPDFEVRRVRLSAGEEMPIEELACYRLAMVVKGEMQVGIDRFHAEQALLLPRSWSGTIGSARPDKSLLFLLALPRS